MSAGVPRSPKKIAPQRVTPHSAVKIPADTDTEQYKDRVETLILVSTLIITATFAASFSMPGGNSDSDPDQGIANMIKHSMFHLFILSITISMYIWCH